MSVKSPPDPFLVLEPSPPPSGFWSRILEILGRLDPRGLLREPASPRDSEAFSVSLIALGAKLAKADGRITRDEVRTFRAIVEIPPGEERHAARVFDLCGRETTGYDAYARKMDRSLGEGVEADLIRRDVLDMLFHIALADDDYHPEEKAFLAKVAEIFRISEAEFEMLEARHVPETWSPHVVLGIAPDADLDAIRRARRRIARESHPDLMAARGMPREMVALATARLSDANRAADELVARLAAKRRDRAPEPEMSSAPGW